MLLLFVVRSNACLGLYFVLFILDIFVVSLGCLFLYQKHVRLLVSLVFVSAMFFAFLFLSQGSRACLHTHTTGLRMQAHVCECILLPRNPNLSFLLLFLYFFHIKCLCLDPLLCFLSPCFFVYLLFVLNMLDQGFPSTFSLFYHEHAYDMIMH